MGLAVGECVISAAMADVEAAPPLKGNHFYTELELRGMALPRILWQPLFMIGTHEPVRFYVMRMMILGARHPYLFAPIAIRESATKTEDAGQRIVSSIVAQGAHNSLRIAGTLLDGHRRRYLGVNMSDDVQQELFGETDEGVYFIAGRTAVNADRDPQWKNFAYLLAASTTQHMAYSDRTISAYHHLMFLMVTHFFRNPGTLSDQVAAGSIDACVADIEANMTPGNDAVYGRNSPLCRLTNRPYELFEAEAGGTVFERMVRAVDRYVAEVVAAVVAVKPELAILDYDPIEVDPFELASYSDQPPSTREIAGRITMCAVGIAWALSTTNQIEHPRTGVRLENVARKTVIEKRYVYWASARRFLDARVTSAALRDLFRTRRLTYNRLMDPAGEYRALMLARGFDDDGGDLPLPPAPAPKKPAPARVKRGDGLPPSPPAPARVKKVAPAPRKRSSAPAPLFDETVEVGGGDDDDDELPLAPPKRRGGGGRKITNQYATLPELPYNPPLSPPRGAAASSSSSSRLVMQETSVSIREELELGLYTMMRIGHPFAFLHEPTEPEARRAMVRAALAQWHAEHNSMYALHMPPPTISESLVNFVASRNRSVLLKFLMRVAKIHASWQEEILLTVMRVVRRESLADVMALERHKFSEHAPHELATAARALGLHRTRGEGETLPDGWYRPFAAKLLAVARYAARQGPPFFYRQYGTSEDVQRMRQAALPHKAPPPVADTPPMSPDATGDFDLDLFLAGVDAPDYGDDGGLGLFDELPMPPPPPPPPAENDPVPPPGLLAPSPAAGNDPFLPLPGDLSIDFDDIVAGVDAFDDWLVPANESVLLASPVRSPMRAPTPAQAATAGEPMVAATPVVVPPVPVLPPTGTIDTTQMAQSLLAYARARMHNVAASLEHVGLGRDGRVSSRPTWTVR